jgi:radical SAM protein with 4Fe4S-binding SPASM domain
MRRLEASIITTYRCFSRCERCHIWKHPARRDEEFDPSLLEKLPSLSFCNITGGEPFVREDLEEIVRVLRRKAQRIVISTNGYLVEKIVHLATRYPDIGFRISLEGLPATNDALRGMEGGAENGLRTLRELQGIGVKDLGMAMTVSDRNACDLVELYRLSRSMGVEFATAAVHNSFYFHISENAILKKEEVTSCFECLVEELLGTWKVKNWYRAFFNDGLVRYILGQPRPLPCTAGTDLFFLDPRGNLLPCNGMEEGLWFETMGNLLDRPFEEIWTSEKARAVREKVRHCPKQCWMIGTASPAIKRHPLRPTMWVLKNKFKNLFP